MSSTMELQQARWFPQSLLENGACFGVSSLPSLTAWLSLCMLTSGWVATLPPQVRSHWSMAGLFGLVAAAGLDVVRRGRQAWHKQRQDRMVQERVLRNLTELADRNAQAMEIRMALQECSDMCQEGSTRHDSRRGEGRLRVRIPVRVSAAVDGPGSTGPAVSGSVLTISPGGLGLMMQRKVDSSLVTVVLQLSDSTAMSLAVELLWTVRQTDGSYAAGGKVLQVLSESASPAHAARACEHGTRIAS